MGLHKDEGDAALALAEECAEVIQVINKMVRFGSNWDDVPPTKDINQSPVKTRWQLLEAEMEDVFYQWERLKNSRGLK